MKHITLFLLLCGMFLAGLAQAPVFVNAYDNEIYGNDLAFTSGNDLLIGGDKLYPVLRPTRNRSDFGLMRVDSLGQPMLTKVYDLAPADHLAYVKNAPQGYVWGGISGRHQGGSHNLLVITRTNLGGQVRWSKAFRPLHRGTVVLSGLDVNRDGDIVFAALTRTLSSSTTPVPVVEGIVAKLDSAGNLLWTRRVILGDRFPLEAAPDANVAFGYRGQVLAGWQFGRVGAPGSSGIAFQGYGPSGALRWSKAYRANGLLAMTYVAADSGLAAYALDTLQHSGLIRLDTAGNVRYAFLDNLQGGPALAARPQAKIEADGPRIPYAIFNQLTLHASPTATPTAGTMPAVAVERPALLSDFAVHGRQAYILGSVYYPPNQKRYPVLLKSAFAQVDNCFTHNDSTLIRSRFPLPPLRVNLAPANATVIALRDSAVRLRVHTLRTRDSLACIGDGDVWPGDANSDGIAEVKDVFAIGLAFGSRGPQRPNATLRWTGQPARNWGRNFFNGANFKHADCDGNGRIERADVRAIQLNYGRRHRKMNLNGHPGDAPLFVQLPTEGLTAGQKVRVPVHLGDAQMSSGDIHGLTFSVTYDPALVGEDLSFTPTQSWLGIPESNLEWVEMNFHEDGVLEVGLTRTNSIDAHGEGVIGYLSFTLATDSSDGRSLSFSLANTEAINSREEEFLLYGKESTTLLVSANAAADQMDMNPSEVLSEVTLFPNPAREQLNVQTRDSNMNRVEVLDLFGKVLLQTTVSGTEARLHLPVLPEGVYFLKVYTDEGVEMQQLRIE